MDSGTYEDPPLFGLILDFFLMERGYCQNFASVLGKSSAKHFSLQMFTPLDQQIYFTSSGLFLADLGSFSGLCMCRDSCKRKKPHRRHE
jgi:hypothetical protein